MGSTTEPEEPSAESASGFALTLAVLLTLLAATGIAQLPFGLTPSWAKTQATNLSVVWPQGWSFFASEFDTEGITVYRGPGGSRPGRDITESHASGRNEWGFGETAAEQNLEIGELAGRLPVGAWHPCVSGTTLACARGLAAVRVVNGSTDPTLCGPLILARVSFAPVGRAPVVKSIADLQVICP